MHPRRPVPARRTEKGQCHAELADEAPASFCELGLRVYEISPPKHGAKHSQREKIKCHGIWEASLSETYFERFRKMMDAMEFETLPLFSKPYFSWHLKTDYTGRRSTALYLYVVPRRP